jgi:hypothetical protein
MAVKQSCGDASCRGFPDALVRCPGGERHCTICSDALAAKLGRECPGCGKWFCLECAEQQIRVQLDCKSLFSDPAYEAQVCLPCFHKNKKYHCFRADCECHCKPKLYPSLKRESARWLLSAHWRAYIDGQPWEFWLYRNRWGFCFKFVKARFALPTWLEVLQQTSIFSEPEPAVTQALDLARQHTALTNPDVLTDRAGLFFNH